MRRRESDLTVDLSTMLRMEDGDREATTTTDEDFITVKAASDQGDLTAVGESPVVAGEYEDIGPAATELDATASKEEPEPPESKVPTIKVRRSGYAWNFSTSACLSNVPLLIKIVSSAEGWIQGHEQCEEDNQGIKQQGAHSWREGEEAWCHLA
jgi:hypothetical protein